MSEQAAETVNPGQAIYDDLSEEAKAAVDALPSVLFDEHPEFVGRCIDTIRRIDALRPSSWALLVGEEGKGRYFRNIAMNDKVVLGLYKDVISVACEQALLREPVSQELQQLNAEISRPYKDQEIANVKMPAQQLNTTPTELWTAHTRLLERLAALNYAKSAFNYMHRDDVRVKLAMVSGVAVPVPTYVPQDRRGLPMGPKDKPPGKRFWQISAGRGSSDWPLFRNESLIAMSWYDETFDPVSCPEQREQFITCLMDQTSVTRQGAESIWQFRTEMSVGDEVLVYSRYEVLGYGRVTGEYQYDAAQPNYRHRRSVEWGSVEPRATSDVAAGLQQKLSQQRTLIELTADEFSEATGSAAPPTPGLRSTDVRTVVQDGLGAAGLTYTAEQVASFYTALQTKGFVILSGISGTGKSKIAQRFAEMLPDSRIVRQRQLREDSTLIELKRWPYMAKCSRFAIPKVYSSALPKPDVGTSTPIEVVVNGIRGEGKLGVSSPNDGTLTEVHLKCNAREAFAALPNDRFYVDIALKDEDTVGTVTIFSEPPTNEIDAAGSTASNHLFLPVRPDWRDGKALIGYHNPLDGTYQRTAFLDFVLDAADDHRAGNRNAFFVILDEMNLAHVEYYFADVLSVIESGRYPDGHELAGWTVEGIQLDIREADPDLPESLRLPPNLYIVGTVNMDETTHPFSPKVLDRAFTIELTHVDFSNYPPKPSEAVELDDARQALLDAFIDGGTRYPRIDKREIAACVVAHPSLRDDLDSLHKALQRSRLHFGYRVFDEIMQFVFNAEQNGLFTVGAAFDHAVLMKVLPKFNGSRSRLENALFELIQWAHQPGTITSDQRAALRSQFDKLMDEGTPFSSVVVHDPAGTADNWRYPAIGGRAALMMQDLYTDGFASFG